MGSDYTFNRSSEIINTNNLNYRKIYKAILTSESACNIGDLVIVYTSGNNMIPVVVTSVNPFTVSSFNPLNLISSEKTSDENTINSLEMFIGDEPQQVLIRKEGSAIIVNKTYSWNSIMYYKNEYGLSETISSKVQYEDTLGTTHEGYYNVSQGYWVKSIKCWYTNSEMLNSAGYTLL